jgi:hypothetical protein
VIYIRWAVELYRRHTNVAALLKLNNKDYIVTFVLLQSCQALW